MIAGTCKPTYTPAGRGGSDAFPLGAKASGVADRGASFLGPNEPCLEDLLGDPVLRRLMASDGVEVDALRALISDMRTRLTEG